MAQGCWSVVSVCATSYSWTTGSHWGAMESPQTAAGTRDPATPMVAVPAENGSTNLAGVRSPGIGSDGRLVQMTAKIPLRGCEPLGFRRCPVTPLLRCDPRMGATTVSSMDGHIWRWAGNIPPGFEPEFEPRLAHYSKCYTYTWFGSALQNTYISCLGHDDASSDSFDGANACAVLPRPVSGASHAERVLGPLFVRPRYSCCPVCDLLWFSAWLHV